MSHVRNTKYSFNLGNDYKRLMGRKNYGIDIDMIEYKYVNNKVEFVAIIDWKHNSAQRISDKYSAAAVYKQLAADYNIPFFFNITFLDDQYETKMFFVIPINNKAQTIFAQYNKDLGGEWMTLKGYSKFLTHLRGDTWNGSEKIDERNCVNLGSPIFKTLNDLPDVKIMYKLPRIELLVA